MYSDEDVTRLLLLKQAVDSGRRIGDIGGLSTDELRRLLETDTRENQRALHIDDGRAAMSAERREPASSEDGDPKEAPGAPAADFVREALESVFALDPGALRAVIAKATVDMGIAAVLDLVISPFMREIGDSWRRGDLRIYQEHLATETVRRFLGTLLDRGEQVPGGLVVVAATPSRQMHEIGALLAAVSVTLEGHRAVYLGPNVPAHELIRACEVFRADVLLLGVSYPANDDRLVDELLELSAALRGKTRIILGGSAARRYAEQAMGASFEIIAELRELRDRLTAAGNADGSGGRSHKDS